MPVRVEFLPALLDIHPVVNFTDHRKMFFLPPYFSVTKSHSEIAILSFFRLLLAFCLILFYDLLVNSIALFSISQKMAVSFTIIFDIGCSKEPIL